MSRICRDLAIGAFPAMVVAYSSAQAAPDDINETNTIIYPAIYGVATLLIVIIFFEGTPLLYRVVAGKVPKGRARTLRHFDRRAMQKIETQLRLERLSSQSWVCYSNDLEEEEEFAAEISDLLERSGWMMMQCGQGGCGGHAKRPVDVEIYQPDGGSPGLVLLHNLITKSGYRSILYEGGGIGHACVQVGTPTH